MTTKTSKKRVVKNPKKSNADHKKGVWPGIKRDFSKLNQQRRNFLQRRPHRSFRLSDEITNEILKFQDIGR